MRKRPVASLIGPRCLNKEGLTFLYRDRQWVLLSCIVVYMSTEITRTETITDGLDTIAWTLIIDGEQVGQLDAHVSGLILNVEIDKACRGEGLARRLYETACETLALLHAPAWGRTYEGDIFAQAMGGDVMDDQQACNILGLDIDIVTGAAFA